MVNWLLRNSASEHHKTVWAGLGLPSPALNQKMPFLLTFILLLPSSVFGIITFERLFGFPPGYAQDLGGITVTQDGGYLVPATTMDSRHRCHIRTAKLDSSGFIEWLNMYETGTFAYRGVDTTADGNYLVPGILDEGAGARGITDALLLKLSPNRGTVIWRYIYSGPGMDWFDDVDPTPDGGCFAVGEFSSDTVIGTGVVRFNQDGTVRWLHIYRPRSRPELYATGGNVLSMPDGGCVVAAGFQVEGPTPPPNNPLKQRSGCAVTAGFQVKSPEQNEFDWDYWMYVMRLDSFGEPVWIVIEPTPPDYDYTWSTSAFTPEGNIAIQGTVGGPGNPGDSVAGFLKVYTPDGEKLLDKTVMVRRLPAPHPPDPWVFFRGGTTTPDGGFVMIGEVATGHSGDSISIGLVRLDANGDSVWCRLYGTDTTWEYGWAVKNTRDGGFVILGQLWWGGPIYVIKTDSNGLVNSGVNEEISRFDQQRALSVLPNPFTTRTKICYQLPTAASVRITAFDIAGRTVATLLDQNQSPGSYEFVWDPKQLARGIYFIKFETPIFGATQPCLFLP
ncbi:T9SS type A sorting domain-containing protein [candidate division WOR-3 bacterium]|jgi:hypothetical protein|nr:T9SS type A sorting domain-containing protein [candidate division WOR-3 bacterium]